MNDEKIIELISNEFDSNDSFSVASSLEEVEAIYRHFESFCSNNSINFEHDVEAANFEDVDISDNPDEDREEVKFEVPIADTELKFEFIYFKEDENMYRVWVDADYYLEEDEDDGFN